MRRSTRTNSHHPHRQPAAAGQGGGAAAGRQKRERRARSTPRCDEAVADVIAKQQAAGIDIINDGEQGRTDYTVHVIDRLTGFEGQSDAPRGTGEPEFPELAQLLQPVRLAVPAPAGLLGPGGVEGFRRGRSRHRARQGGDDQGRRRRNTS